MGKKNYAYVIRTKICWADQSKAAKLYVYTALV